MGNLFHVQEVQGPTQAQQVRAARQGRQESGAVGLHITWVVVMVVGKIHI